MAGASRPELRAQLLRKSDVATQQESGRELPAYRELALVLEPWMYRENSPITGFTEDDTRRWERRFLG